MGTIKKDEQIIVAARGPLYWAGLVFLFVLIAFGLVLVSYVSRINPNLNSMSINSTCAGKVVRVPDLAVINFSLISVGDNAGEAQTMTTEKSSKVLDYLKEKGVSSDDIKTTGYSIRQKYENIPPCEAPVAFSVRSDIQPMPCNFSYNLSELEIEGYEAVASYEIKVRDENLLGDISEGVVKNGAEEVSGISFVIEDRESALTEARVLALGDAKKKAMELEKSTGIKLGDIVSYYEDQYPGIYGGEKMMSSYEMYGGYGGGGVPLEAGQGEIVVNVNLAYQVR